MSKAKKVHTKVEEHSTNGWDVCIKGLDVGYNLANSGNVIGLLLLGFMIIVGIVSWRLTPEQLNGHVSFIFAFLAHEKYFFIPLVSLNVFLVYVIRFQNRIHKAEIKRLTKERQELMHGRQNGTLRVIPEHQSSNFDLDC